MGVVVHFFAEHSDGDASGNLADDDHTQKPGKLVAIFKKPVKMRKVNEWINHLIAQEDTGVPFH